MRQEDKRARDLERLEAMERRVQERLARQQERINQRFERARQRLGHKYGDPDTSQQRIIEAALQLLDEDGLNNLSLRKLAASVDMKAPALYWHFKNKEDLIDHMAEAILRSEFSDLAPRRADEAWQDWLVQACSRLRQAMRSHRDGARVVAGAHLYPAVTLMRLFETCMESLTSAGVELQQANLMITTAVHFVFGNVIEEQAAPSLEQIGGFLQTDFFKEYPLMYRSVQQTFEDAKGGYDEFEDSLRLIVGYAPTSEGAHGQAL